MADLTPGKKPTDPRQALIRQRRLQHEINSIRVSVEKFEIDILEAEQGIERTREGIQANNARILLKEAELREAQSAQEE